MVGEGLLAGFLGDQFGSSCFHRYALVVFTQRNVSYARLALYVLGADWYNFVADPGFAHGDAHGLKGTAMPLGEDMDATGKAERREQLEFVNVREPSKTLQRLATSS